MFEVEVKAKLADLSSVKEKLKEAKFLGVKKQNDHVYGYDGDFPPKDGGIIGRIRETDGKKVLELKEIDREKGGIEIPYEISSLEPYHEFLLKLGMKKFFNVEKEREKYELNGFTICLDKVTDLGQFIEVEKIIENDSEREKTMQECKEFLEKLADKFELTKEKYGDMMCRKLGIFT